MSESCLSWCLLVVRESLHSSCIGQAVTNVFHYHNEKCVTSVCYLWKVPLEEIHDGGRRACWKHAENALAHMCGLVSQGRATVTEENCQSRVWLNVLCSLFPVRHV